MSLIQVGTLLFSSLLMSFVVGLGSLCSRRQKKKNMFIKSEMIAKASQGCCCHGDPQTLFLRVPRLFSICPWNPLLQQPCLFARWETCTLTAAAAAAAATLRGLNSCRGLRVLQHLLWPCTRVADPTRVGFWTGFDLEFRSDSFQTAGIRGRPQTSAGFCVERTGHFPDEWK